ncbi:hypothetical protein Pfo_030832, partial [Paulownia fortunei]
MEANTFQFMPFCECPFSLINSTRLFLSRFSISFDVRKFLRRFNLLKRPRVRDMGDSGSSADSSSEGLSAVLVNEKGRNKRKFLSDLSLDVPVEVSTLSLTEF